MEPRKERGSPGVPGGGVLSRLLVAGVLLGSCCLSAFAGVSPQCSVPDAFLALRPGLPATASALREGHAVRILLVGSKISGPDQPERRGEMLKAELGKRLPGADFEIEASDPGAFMAETQFERIRSDLDRAEPQLIVWQAGFAEALAGADPDEFEASLVGAAGWIAGRGIDLLFVDPPYVGGVEHERSYWPVVERISAAAEKANANVFRRYAATQFLAGRTDLRSSRRGCVPELLAEAIARVVAPKAE